MNKQHVRPAVDWLKLPPPRHYWECNRLQIAAQSMGIDLSLADVYKVWLWWSDLAEDKWSKVPTDDEECIEELGEALELLVDRWQDDETTSTLPRSPSKR